MGAKEDGLCDVCHIAGVGAGVWPSGSASPMDSSLEGKPSLGRAPCCCGEGRLLLVVFIDLVTHGGWWLFVVRSCSEGFLDTPATTLKGQ